MATVTGFTSERMLEIENNTVVDGNVVGDDLILVKHDLTQINAGNVRGPQGIQGPVGQVSDAELTAALAVLDASLPQGHIAQAIVTAAQGPFTSIVNLTGLSVTFTAVANRRYLLILEAHYHCSTGTTQVEQFITLSDNTQLRATKLVASASQQTYLRTEHIVTPAAGSITYKGRVSAGANSTMSADSLYYASFRVQDIGSSV